MSEQPEPHQSFIGKIAKLISPANLSAWFAIFTALLAAYTSYQAHKVTTQVSLLDNNIKKATLVKDLIEILASSKDKKTHKDIALIVLNRTISQDQETKLMTAEIAEQIYRDNHAVAKSYAEEYDLNPRNKGKNCKLFEVAAFPTSAVAFQVIEKNNPDRSQVLLRELGDEVKKTDRKTATTKPNTISCVKALKSHYSFFNKVTWLQFNKPARRHDVERFGEKLNEIGFNVPKNGSKIETELVSSSGYKWINDEKRVSSVRFYHLSDRPRAERLKKLTQKFFNHDVVLDDLSIRVPDKPFGQVEIWIYDDLEIK